MFWALGIILLLTAALVAFWPLLSGSPQLKLAGVTLALTIPLASIGLYQGVGTPAALDPQARQPLESAAGDMASLADQLRARLTESPDSLEGWVLLGRTYKTMQRYDEAVEALETAERLQPGHPIVLVELVEARLFASGNPRLSPDMVELLEDAVASNPGLQKGYWLLGIAAAQRGDDRAAIEWWEALLQSAAPASGVADAVTAQIAEARGRLGEVVNVPPNAAMPRLFDVEVTLPQQLQESLTPLPPTAALFVIVRPADPGSGPPLGVQRVETPRFPVIVELSDADSMLPQRPISAVGTVEVQARLSMSGEPLASPGDWQSRATPIRNGESTQLALDQQIE